MDLNVRVITGGDLDNLVGRAIKDLEETDTEIVVFSRQNGKRWYRVYILGHEAFDKLVSFKTAYDKPDEVLSYIQDKLDKGKLGPYELYLMPWLLVYVIQFQEVIEIDQILSALGLKANNLT